MKHEICCKEISLENNFLTLFAYQVTLCSLWNCLENNEQVRIETEIVLVQ